MSVYSPSPSPDSNSGTDPPDDEDGGMLKGVVLDIFDDLIDEVALGVCFEVHKMNRQGTLFLADSDPESMKQFEIVDQYGLDVFGQVPMKKQLECICPNCSRNLAASRFAPHLEKCMGMGRNSSRIASRRIANAGTKKESDESDGPDDDVDWSSSSNKTSKRKKDRAANSRNKRQNKLNKNNGHYNQGYGGQTVAGPHYENMTHQDRKSLLRHACGVISEHTKRMCTRSSKCKQHTDDQRRHVRAFLLSLRSGTDAGDDDNVDIDSYADGDSQALRDTLQWEAGSNPSPTDSTSTTNSSAESKKRLNKKSTASRRRRGPGRPSHSRYVEMT